MIVIKLPIEWTPEWPAFPIDALVCPCGTTEYDLDVVHHSQWDGPEKVWFDPDCPNCDKGIVDPAALLGPKTQRCLTPGRSNETHRVPQRVALAIERPCETCEGEGVFHEERSHSGGDIADMITGHCPDCDGSGVRLVVEYTAQVDAMVKVVTHHIPGWHVYVWSNGHVYLVWPSEHQRRLPDADWSPSRWAVLTSDVQLYGDGQSAPRAFARSFPGPIANLEEVLI